MLALPSFISLTRDSRAFIESDSFVLLLLLTVELLINKSVVQMLLPDVAHLMIESSVPAPALDVE